MGISTQQRATAVTLVTTTETAALTIPFSGGVARNPSLANPLSGSVCKLKISGLVNVNVGAGTTSVQVRLRRGANTVTGTQVGNTIPFPSGALASGIDFEFQDLTPGFAQAYTVTVQQVGATANGSVTEIVGSTQDFN